MVAVAVAPACVARLDHSWEPLLEDPPPVLRVVRVVGDAQLQQLRAFLGSPAVLLAQHGSPLVQLGVEEFTGLHPRCEGAHATRVGTGEVYAVREVLLEVPGVVVVGCDGEFNPLVDALDGVVLRVEFDDCELEPRRSIDADDRSERLARRADGVGGRSSGLRRQRRDADRVIVLEKVPVELVVGFSPLALPAERRVVLRVHRRIFPVAEALADEVGERP